MIGCIQVRGNKEIVATGTNVGTDEYWAEVAFVVRDDFQHHGVASCLLKKLKK